MNKYVKPLRKSTRKNRYVNLLRREVGRSMPLRGRGITIKERSNGVVIEARPGGPPGSSPVGIVFRGEYNSGRLYDKSDAVKISGGIASGLYVRITDQTTVTEQPWMGGGWVQLSKLLDQWL